MSCRFASKASGRVDSLSRSTTNSASSSSSACEFWASELWWDTEARGREFKACGGRGLDGSRWTGAGDWLEAFLWTAGGDCLAVEARRWAGLEDSPAWTRTGWEDPWAFDSTPWSSVQLELAGKKWVDLRESSIHFLFLSCLHHESSSIEAKKREIEKIEDGLRKI